MQENPFTVSSDYLFKINKWLLEKAPEMESISFGGNLAHDYEVFLQDECPNPKFDVKSSTSRAPYKGFYDLEGMKRYMERGEGLVHQDNFKHFIDNKELKVSKMAYGTQSDGFNKIRDMQIYNGIKISVMSGGVNHIDTGCSFRM